MRKLVNSIARKSCNWNPQAKGLGDLKTHGVENRQVNHMGKKLKELQDIATGRKARHELVDGLFPIDGTKVRRKCLPTTIALRQNKKMY